MEPKLLSCVTSVNVHIDPTNPSVLVIAATGEAPTEGYTDSLLEPLEYAREPENGVYEFLLTGIPPEERRPKEPSAITAKTFHWIDFPKRLKSVIVIGYENSIAAAVNQEDLVPQNAGDTGEENY